MSEYILCRGKEINKLPPYINVVKANLFLENVARVLWEDKNAWTITVANHSIDYFLLEAKEEIVSGLQLNETKLFEIIRELTIHKIQFAMWYDVFYDELPKCKELSDIYDLCMEGIMDKSGMCEVYFEYAP